VGTASAGAVALAVQGGDKTGEKVATRAADPVPSKTTTPTPPEVVGYVERPDCSAPPGAGPNAPVGGGATGDFMPEAITARTPDEALRVWQRMVVQSDPGRPEPPPKPPQAYQRAEPPQARGQQLALIRRDGRGRVQHVIHLVNVGTEADPRWAVERDEICAEFDRTDGRA
jgi:hypothetical protein